MIEGCNKGCGIGSNNNALPVDDDAAWGWSGW